MARASIPAEMPTPALAPAVRPVECDGIGEGVVEVEALVCAISVFEAVAGVDDVDCEVPNVVEVSETEDVDDAARFANPPKVPMMSISRHHSRSSRLRASWADYSGGFVCYCIGSRLRLRP